MYLYMYLRAVLLLKVMQSCYGRLDEVPGSAVLRLGSSWQMRDESAKHYSTMSMPTMYSRKLALVAAAGKGYKHDRTPHSPADNNDTVEDQAANTT